MAVKRLAQASFSLLNRWEWYRQGALPGQARPLQDWQMAKLCDELLNGELFDTLDGAH